MMGDSASESDSGSVDGGNFAIPLQSSKEVLTKRNDSLQQENRVLKMELDTFKLRVRTLQEENRALRQASVNIQVKAEQEEEFISNTLMKQIKALKTEKEKLALNYEQEEECLTNDLSRRLELLRHEKAQLEQTLEQEQEAVVNKLMRKINKLEADTAGKQASLEQLRREKVELENTLEQEQEALVNRLWKRMDKLEAEKRMLQQKLDQVASAVTVPEDINNGDLAANLAQNIECLRNEVVLLKEQLISAEREHYKKMDHFAMEEKNAKEENVRLQKRLQMEVERRVALSRHLSESESSLEMEEERQFNDHHTQCGQAVRPRAGSSPALSSMLIMSPYVPPSGPSPARSSSPCFNISQRELFASGSPMTSRCTHCGHTLPSAGSSPMEHMQSPSSHASSMQGTCTPIAVPQPFVDNFLKPSPPPPHHHHNT